MFKRTKGQEMTYKLRDIRNLRVDWRGEYVGNHSAAIHFESGDRRFHVWLRAEGERETRKAEEVDQVSFKFDNCLHSNPIDAGRFGGSQHRGLDFNAPTHKALRDLITLYAKQSFGSIDGAVRYAANKFAEAYEFQQQRHRDDLAKNIRTAIFDKGESLSPDLQAAIDKASDRDLIVLRGIMYAAKYPDEKDYYAEGSANLKGEG